MQAVKITSRISEVMVVRRQTIKLLLLLLLLLF